MPLLIHSHGSNLCWADVMDSVFNPLNIHQYEHEEAPFYLDSTFSLNHEVSYKKDSSTEETPRCPVYRTAAFVDLKT